MQAIMEQLQPALLELLATVLTVVISMAAMKFRALTGITIEEKHREALHSAVISGVQAAMAEGLEAGTKAFTDRATAHIHQSVPDAIAMFKPSAEVLASLVARYVKERF